MTPSPNQTVRLTMAATAAVALAFLLPAVAVVLRGVNAGPQFADQAEYHLPTVEAFARQWPAFDLASPRAAMTPGYHLLMAGLYRATSGDVRALQLATAAITAGFLATLAWAVGRRAPAVDAVLLCLPLAWSPYVFTSGAYVVPHNLSWWAVLGGMLVALRPRVDRWTYVAGGLLLLAAVLTRQIHLWLLAPLLVAAWFGGGGASPIRQRATRVLLTTAAALPAVLALAYFVRIWGGLAPRTQEWARPAAWPNLAAVAVVLATFGAVGLFYFGYRSRKPGRPAAALGALSTGALAAVPVSTYDKDAGRWSGVWNLVRHAPVVGERSVLIVALAAVGGAVVGATLAALRSRERWVIAAAVAGFVAAHAAVSQAWQRYYEPFALIVLALAAADVLGRGATAGDPRVRRGLLVALAIVQAALTVMSLWH